jgi:hypothetical protein
MILYVIISILICLLSPSLEILHNQIQLILNHLYLIFYLLLNLSKLSFDPTILIDYTLLDIEITE